MSKTKRADQSRLERDRDAKDREIIMEARAEAWKRKIGLKHLEEEHE